MGAPRDFRSAHLVRYKTYNGQLFIIQQFVDKNGHIGYRHRDRDCDSRHLPTIVEEHICRWLSAYRSHRYW